jgi:signal transduction histidine kinase/AraC-like DNA-binding protein
MDSGCSAHWRQLWLTILSTHPFFSRTLPPQGEQLRHEIADLIRANYGYDNVQIFLWADDRHELVLDRLDEDPSDTIRIPLAEAGLLGYTLLRNRPTFVPDMQHSQRFPPDPYWPATRSRVIVPIRLGDEFLGLLDLHSCQLTRQTYEDLLGLQSLADQLGVSMRNVQLYGEARAAHAEAERANLLKSRLLANVSHELRTPLNVIQGYSQSALAIPGPYGVELPSELRSDLQHIYQSSEHLGRLINDVLDVAQAETGMLDIIPQPLNPRDLLVNVFQIMAGSKRADSHVEWRLQLSDILPEVYADPVRLRQILFNLLSNASKFTARGHITLGAQSGEDHLHIWVEDTGCGVTPDLQAQIFATFNTAEHPRRLGQGIGLGLRITYELVKLHRGAITLESIPDSGTAFHVLLPILTAEQRVGHEKAAAQAARLHAFPDSPGALPPQISGLTRQAVAYFCQRYANVLSRDEIADHLGVTSGYLTRVFRKDLGLTPWEYLTQLRIARAKHLLGEDALSITEVAGRVGYDDPAYFSRVFLKETGHTPRAFRKLARERLIVSNSPT